MTTPGGDSRLERGAWLMLLLLVFSLPMEKGVSFDSLGTISRLIGMAAFAVGAVAVARRRTLRVPNAALLLAAVFVLWSGATYFWSVAPPATAARFATLVQLFGMMALIWELCRHAGGPAQLMQAYLAGAAVSSVWTIVRAVNNQQTYYRRFATSGFDPNDLGVTLALALPMALYLSLRERGVRAAACRAGALLTIAGILLTASRTALLASYAALLFPALMWRASRWSHRWFTLALLAGLALGPVSLAPRARQRLQSLPVAVARGNFNNRTRIWKVGLKVLKRRWPAGVGASGYPEAVRPWLGTFPIAGQQYTAHNTFLSVLVETGLPGFAIFGSLLLVLAWFAWTAGGAERALWLTGLLVWAVGVFTLSWESRKPTWLVFALIVATWALTFRRAPAVETR